MPEAIVYKIHMVSNATNVRRFLLSLPVIDISTGDRVDCEIDRDRYSRPAGSRAYISKDKDIYICDQDMNISSPTVEMLVNLNADEDIQFIKDEFTKFDILMSEFEKVKAL